MEEQRLGSTGCALETAVPFFPLRTYPPGPLDICKPGAACTVRCAVLHRDEMSISL